MDQQPRKMETSFVRRSRTANAIVSDPIRPKFELLRLSFMHVLVTCKYEKGRVKNNLEKVETTFPPLYKYMKKVFAAQGKFTLK